MLQIERKIFSRTLESSDGGLVERTVMATLSPWQKLHTKVSQESEQCTRKKPVTVISTRGLRVEHVRSLV